MASYLRCARLARVGARVRGSAWVSDELEFSGLVSSLSKRHALDDSVPRAPVLRPALLGGLLNDRNVGGGDSSIEAVRGTRKLDEASVTAPPSGLESTEALGELMISSACKSSLDSVRDGAASEGPVCSRPSGNTGGVERDSSRFCGKANGERRANEGKENRKRLM